MFKTSAKTITRILSLLYLLILVWILVFKMGVRFSYMEERSVNLVPFGASQSRNGSFGTAEVILNMLIFVPVGVYAAALGWRLGLLLVFLLSFVLELVQYLFRVGAFDVTDIITNTIGGAMGYLLFLCTRRLLGSHERTQNWLSAVAIPITLVFIVLLVLLRLGMLPIRYQ